MTSMFCDLALGARIERAEAGLIATGAEAASRRHGGTGFVLSVAGGVAAFADEGSPLNKVAGLGFDGTPTATELDRIEGEFARCGAPVQVELAQLADVPAPAVADGIQVRRSGDDEFDLWSDVLSEGMASPDTKGVVSHEEFPRDVIAAAMRDMGGAGVTRYLATVDGRVAGGASVRVADGVAQMSGAATLPAERRRGVQAALLATRLVDVVAAGCDVAVVTTQPGSTSQANVQRQGLDLLYTRAVLVRS